MNKSTLTEKELSQIHSILFVIEQMGGSVDLHKLSKILYFADQKHLAQFGRSITEAKYKKMKFGPVPSEIYELINTIRFNRKSIKTGLLKQYLDIDQKSPSNYNLIANHAFDEDELSKSEIRCLQESIHENGNKSFDYLSEKSHQLAWNNAVLNHEINPLDIAREAGASEEMVNHIREIEETKTSRIA